MSWYTWNMVSTKRPVAVAYRRVSTDRQGRSGLGLADQDQAIRQVCEARNLTLEAEFTEIESGRNDSRPQLRAALETTRRRGGVLVIATLSRLGRRVSFVSALMEQGVPFACADAPDDDVFILHVKAAFAEEERRKISARTKAALMAAKARGTKLGNPTNLTLEHRRAGAAVQKARAAEVRAKVTPDVLAAREEGLSIRAIAKRTNLSPMTVQRILKDVQGP
jgi:DNA invertase Pin-like site-specific DNA recombinase